MYSRCLLLSLPAAPLTFPPHNKRAPLNALYGVKVGVLESCHLIGSEDFAIPQSQKTTFVCAKFILRLGAEWAAGQNGPGSVWCDSKIELAALIGHHFWRM